MSKELRECPFCGGERMSNLFCPWCNHNNITSEGINHYCNHCGYAWKSKPTVFDRITQSPEALAEKLLYAPLGEFCKLWYSTVLPGEHWNVKEEAIAATVAKLKDVEE
jgi:hypothetical protein